MDRLIGDFRRHQTRRNLSPLTVSHRCQQVRNFSLWLNDQGVELLNTTPRDIDDWLDTRDIGPATRATYLSYVGSFFKWAYRAGLVEASPVDLMDRPRTPDRLPRPIDDDDLTIALEEAEPRMRAWLMLGALQGMRVSSMARLTVDGVDRHAMRLRFWIKGDREHSMHLHPDVLAALDAYGLPTSGFVFTKETEGMENDPLSAATISRYVGRFLHDLGSEATAHRLRHWFVTKVVELTGDITVAADLAAHRNIETTNKYTKVLAEKGRVAMAGMTLPGDTGASLS